MEQERSWRDRGREAARKVTEPIMGVTDAVSGASVARAVNEYTETLTQVAIGLHADVSSASERLRTVEARLSDLADAVQARQERADAVRRIQLISALALLISVAALGVSIWTAL